MCRVRPDGRPGRRRVPPSETGGARAPAARCSRTGSGDEARDAAASASGTGACAACSPDRGRDLPDKTLAQLNDEKPLGDVLFGLDSTDLSDAARTILQKDVDWMKKWPTTKVMVEGHADSRGTNEYNLALGERRADGVRDYMVSLGVATDRITIVSKGEEQPICSEEIRGLLAAEPPRTLHRHGQVGSTECSMLNAVNVHSTLSISIRAFSDSFRRGSGIGGRDDWPADDDVAGARGDRFAGAHRPLLVVFSSPAAADSWRHDREISPASLPDRRGLLRRCHDPIEPGRLRELCKAKNVIHDGSRDRQFPRAPRRSCW